MGGRELFYDLLAVTANLSIVLFHLRKWIATIALVGIFLRVPTLELGALTDVSALFLYWAT